MSYRQSKNQSGTTDIVIDGWELGIASSPHKGIANMRNVNIRSTPGEVAVNFKTSALTKPPTVSAVAFTVETTDILTVASTSGWYNGMAVTLNSLVDGTGLATGRVYWVGNLSGNTFKLYKNPSRPAGQLVDVTLAGSGTISSYTLGKPIDKATDKRGQINGTFYTFILDANGLVWWIDNAGGTQTNNLVYLGNDTVSGTNGRGLAMFKDYLIVFRTTTVDAIAAGFIEQSIDFDGASGWTYGWESIDSYTTLVRRPILVGQDEVMYYAGSTRVQSISQNVGSTFDPTSGATYTENISALDLPSTKLVTAIGELGIDLLVGTNGREIYPWDRISPSFRIPLTVAEENITRIETSNNVAYVFAGYRGQIYRTSGSNMEAWRKIPDHISGVLEPYFSFIDTEINDGNLLFSFSATQNDGTNITTLDGVWAVDIETGVFFHLTQLSYGTAGITAIIVRDVLSTTPAGSGIFVGWDNSGVYGVDHGSSNPYSNYETIIESDIIPIGTFTFKETLTQIEYKLSRILVSGEAVRISYRTNLNESYTVVFTSSTAGAISEASDITFENAEWVQIKVELSSTNTTPSRVPLKEIRLRT